MSDFGPRQPTGDDHPHQSTARLIGTYHQQQLRKLLHKLRAGFDRLDDGVIDAFDLDEMIQHYERSTGELRRFCGSSGPEREQAAVTLEAMRARGEEPDWWAAGATA
jgi:hypothetical protein